MTAPSVTPERVADIRARWQAAANGLLSNQTQNHCDIRDLLLALDAATASFTANQKFAPFVKEGHCAACAWPIEGEADRVHRDCLVRACQHAETLTERAAAAEAARDAAVASTAALHAERAGLRETLTDAVVRWEALSKVPISGQSVTLIACANEMREILAHEQEKFALSASPSTDAPAAERTCGLAARWDRTADGCFDCRDKATTPQARARLEAEGNIYRKCAAELRENMPPEPPTATDAFPGKLECLIAVLLADADLSYDETRHRRWLQTAQTMLA